MERDIVKNFGVGFKEMRENAHRGHLLLMPLKTKFVPLGVHIIV